MDQLRTGDLPVIEIAESAGFQSLSACNKQFKRYTGVSPREYRRRCGHLLRDEPVVMTLI